MDDFPKFKKCPHCNYQNAERKKILVVQSEVSEQVLDGADQIAKGGTSTAGGWLGSALGVLADEAAKEGTKELAKEGAKELAKEGTKELAKEGVIRISNELMGLIGGTIVGLGVGMLISTGLKKAFGGKKKMAIYECPKCHQESIYEIS